MTTATFTSDFRHEFQHQTRKLLRRQFLWFTGGMGTLWTTVAVAFVVTALVALASERFTLAPGPDWVVPVWAGCAAALYIGAFGYAWRARNGQRLLPLSLWLVFGDGVLAIAAAALGWGPGVWGVLVVHLAASLILPWSPRQAILPVLGLLAVHAAQVLAVSRPPAGVAVALILASPIIGLPGTLICWMRHSQRMRAFQFSFLQRRYGDLRRELVDARRIHESLFPRPEGAGSLRFDYTYEPMRQIGGDFLFARFQPVAADRDPRLNLLLVDVTGHGIPAALTVNRLHGEVERLFAENPDTPPGEVLRALNRYVHLTLATHSVYVTALCVRIDPVLGMLEYASGGHPPAFLRTVDGKIDQLNATAFVLGACRDADFDPLPERHVFGPGDVLIAYTDGALECRNAEGRMFGLDGLRRTLHGCAGGESGHWCTAIADSVIAYRDGPPADDTLVVEVVRTLAAFGHGAPPSHALPQASAGGPGARTERAFQP